MSNGNGTHIPARIEPKKFQIDEARQLMYDYYNSNPDKLIDKNGHTIDVEKKIAEVIERATVGYPYCPRTFMGRVKNITKINCGTRSGIKKENYYNIRQNKIAQVLADREKKTYPGFSVKDLRDRLSTNEKKFWIEREEYYRTEFDFNNSADQAMLIQVLAEEVIQHRLISERLDDVENAHLQEIEDAMEASFRRLEKGLKALGITREQREKAGSEQEGNIASLVTVVEKKLKKIDALRQKDEEKETFLSKARSTERVLEILPNSLKDVVTKAINTEDY